MRLKFSRGNNRKAFTLMEIMVVVVIIGIVVAAILPEMRGAYEGTLLRSTARELIDAFHLAYSRSVSFNQPHRVRLDPATGKYRVEKRIQTRAGEEFVPLRDIPGGEGKLDTRIVLRIQRPDETGDEQSRPTGSASDESGPGWLEEITFYSDGTADGGDVLLQDRQGFRLALRINPTTSRIQIVELARL